MLIRLAILIMTIAWLVASLPQSRFIWTSTIHEKGGFDYWMGMLRAVIIDFLPLAIVFIQSELEKTHLSKAQRSFTRRKLEEQGHDFETWAKTYPTPEGQIEKRMPLLFGLITAVVAVSYEAYYVEYGQTLQVYETTWNLLGQEVAIGGFVKVLVHAVYLTVAALVTYVFGRLSSAMKVHLVFEDIVKLVRPKKTRQKVVKQPTTKQNKTNKTKTRPCEHCGYPLKVGPDGTTKRAWAGHKRACKEFKEVDYGDL